MGARVSDNQVVYVDGDVPQLPLQLGQLLVDSSQIAVGTTNLQQCTSQSPLVYEPLQGGYPRTQAETSAGSTIVNPLRRPGDIRRYGAVGGNVALDQAGWAAAVAQANQFANDAASIYIPTVTSGFFINAMVAVTRPVQILGDGPLKSLLISATDINALGFSGSASSASIEGVGLTGPYTNTTGSGITCDNVHDILIRNCRITGFGVGVTYTGFSCYNCRIENSRIEGNFIRNIFAQAQTHALSMVSAIYGSSGSNLTPIGMSIVDSNTLVQHACDCEGLRAHGAFTTVVGLDIDATVSLCADYKISTHFENNANTVGEIRIGATAQVQGVVLDGTIMANTAVGTYGLNLVNAQGVTWLGVSFFSDFGTANVNYGTTSKCNIIPADSLTTQGVVSLGNGTVSLPQTAGSQTLTNNATVSTANKTTVRVNEAGNVTGIRLSAGVGTQVVTVLNESNFTITFDVVANSKVADGATTPIPALSARVLQWNAGTALWYRAA